MKYVCKKTPIDKVYNLVGTVKLHGTHADIVYKKIAEDSYDVHLQSRNRVLTQDQDNCGYVKFMTEMPLEVFETLFDAVKERYEDNIDTLMIAGEFCGGNVQKKVALTQLDTMFVIFNIKINGVWQKITDYAHVKVPEHRVFNITRGGLYKEQFSFVSKDAVATRLAEITDAVEKECPFAKSFDVSGTGEGVVWQCEELAENSRYWFKVKGEAHSVTKVKTLKPMSAEEREKLKSAEIFASKVVTEARLEQGLDYLREMNLEKTIKNIGVFIKWVVEDVIKEETDNMKEFSVSADKVKRVVGSMASSFYKLSLMKSDDLETENVASS